MTTKVNLSTQVEGTSDDLTEGVVNLFLSSIDQTKLDNLPSDTNSVLSGKVDKTQTINTKPISGNITLNQDEVLDGTTYKQYSATEKTKLAGIGTGAKLVSIVAGSNVTVDNTDPANPVINSSGGSGLGDVVLPSSATNNAIVLFDTTTGKLIKDSAKTLITTLGSDDTTVPTSKAVKDVTDAKVTGNVAITGATKTKITYDAKGLVTAGADANTADIADSINKRYVTDANLVTIGNAEVTTNKATDFTTINNTLYPTVQAVNNAINIAVTGLLDYRGSYDASTNLYPATGGSGIAGAILKGDFWICSVTGTLGGPAVTPGDLIIALIDTPAQTSTNWDLISHDINYVPENVANKSTNTALGTSDTLYPSQNAVKTYVDTQDALKSDLNIINTDIAVSLYAGDKRKDWSFGIPAFTGAIKIEISGLFGYSMDGRMQVQIKSGATNAITINIDGRWDASTSWSTYNATSDTSINVRFARDGSKVYIIIGEIGTVWQNTRLLIDDVLTNYNVGAPIGFITTTITSLTGLTIDATVNAKNKANLAGDITQSFGASTIELGHRTDTTLSRVSAGVIAVEGVNLGTEGILQNSKSTAYTTVLADAGKHIYHPSADTTARTITINSNANVPYPIGTAITFVNDTSAGVLTIAITSDTLVLAGAGTTGSRTLRANGVATAIKMTSTRWQINGTGLT